MVNASGFKAEGTIKPASQNVQLITIKTGYSSATESQCNPYWPVGIWHWQESILHPTCIQCKINFNTVNIKQGIKLKDKFSLFPLVGAAQSLYNLKVLNKDTNLCT